MGGHLPVTAGSGLISFVDSSGKPVVVCADQVLNGEPWHGFHTGAPLVLSGAEPCQAVVIEGNYHNPGASLCGHPTQAAASGELFAGTLAFGAQDVAVRANRCGSCLPPNCKDCKRCVAVSGVNASSLKSDVNSGWEPEAGTGAGASAAYAAEADGQLLRQLKTDDSGGQFVPFADFGVPAEGAYGLATFRLKGRSGRIFIAVSDFFGGSSSIWSNDQPNGSYSLSQTLPSNAGHSWATFNMGGSTEGTITHLFLCNYRTWPCTPHGHRPCQSPFAKGQHDHLCEFEIWAAFIYQ